MALEDRVSFTISAIRISQPIGDIYVGSIPSNVLVDITDFDIRQLVTERGLDSYLGIQRELDRKRVQEIQQYVKGPDATFPTAVVLAVPEKCVNITSPCLIDDRFVRIELSNHVQGDNEEEDIFYRHIARVIDGQHRIRGLAGYAGPTFDVNVSIFIDADIADQASIFATVNLAQTKVNRSLVYDLFEFSKTRSPEKSCHSIVVALESTKDSPLFRKIKRLGKVTPGRYTETLSQATVVAGILQFICRDRLQVISDRQTGRKSGKFPPADARDADRLVLRPFFIENRDIEMANLIWNFFEAVQMRWHRAWGSNGTGYMLNRTNGFNGLMRYFRFAYKHYAKPGDAVTSDQFLKLFERSKLTDDDFNPQKFLPGSAGAAELAKVLIQETQVQVT